jgi:transcription initiation factor TFIIIB Brf1 subunit/transcription initiation factor TFIIB
MPAPISTLHLCGSADVKKQISMPLRDFAAVETVCRRCGCVLYRDLFDDIARRARAAYDRVVADAMR